MRKHVPEKGVFWTSALLQPLEIHKVFLRVCAAQLPQNTTFQVQGSFAKAYSR